MIDYVLKNAKGITKESINEIYAALSREDKGLVYSETQQVSVDCIGDSRFALIEGDLTAVNKNVLSVRSWYDNEWGYIANNRMLQLYVAQELGIL
jgi:glyceraldehyde-3-phosphate dehydrogenase/erythrose-4-phosphate dehydrogenase